MTTTDDRRRAPRETITDIDIVYWLDHMTPTPDPYHIVCRVENLSMSGFLLGRSFGATTPATIYTPKATISGELVFPTKSFALKSRIVRTDGRGCAGGEFMEISETVKAHLEEFLGHIRVGASFRPIHPQHISSEKQRPDCVLHSFGTELNKGQLTYWEELSNRSIQAFEFVYGEKMLEWSSGKPIETFSIAHNQKVKNSKRDEELVNFMGALLTSIRSFPQEASKHIREILELTS